MNLFTLADGRRAFHQWDTGRQLIVHDEACNEVHFCNGSDDSSLVCKVFDKDDLRLVNVPNILLQDTRSITVFAFVEEESGGYTRRAVVYNVRARSKPDDYVYTETEVLNYQTLAKRMDEWEKHGIPPEVVAGAIKEYFTENPVETGATEEESAQIAKNKEDIDDLKKDKLDASKLPEAVNDALAQAKESGLFDGQPGEPGPAGEPGKDYILTDADKADIAKLVEVPAPDSGGNVTQKEETTTVSVGAESVVLDATAPEQVVNLSWTVDNARTIPAFTNYYIANDNIAYPRTFTASGTTQFWASPNYHGNSDAFVSGHQYLQVFHYTMDGDSVAVLKSGTNYITPTNSTSITGSGWVYQLAKPTNGGQIIFTLTSSGNGTGTIDYLYCIDVTALQESGAITATTINELAELFGELPLIPGENYEGGTIGSGTATLSINRDGETITVDNTSNTVTVKGGDILSVVGGSVTFMLKVIRVVSDESTSVWAGKKWVAFGDSLTDESINADKKYYRYIEEKTGITVVVMGKGGTGYYRTYDGGTAYGQRMAQVPADADVITIFGSVNDWHTKSANVAMGNASDTKEAGTLAGYINECIDVAIEKAPYAQIALVTPMDYKGLPSDTLEGIANIIKAVASYRQIKCLDLYHESGFRVRNPVFAQQFITDYSETGDSYGHPNNLAHEKLIAPEFMELLKRMILTA